MKKALIIVGGTVVTVSLISYLVVASTINAVARAIEGMEDLEPWDSDFYD